MEDQDQKIVNRMFKKQRNVLLVALFSMLISGFFMGFTLMDGPNDTIKVTSDLSWEKMYYDMKKQRDSMKVERDDLESKFEESVRYWQQCETKLNN